jgi:LPXTG-motif cell wall-anchored protein
VERVASKLRLVPGEVLRVDGDGFTPGAVLSVVLRSDPINLGSLKADGRGGFNASVKIPANAPAGRHHIVVSGPNPAGGLRTVSFPIELVSRGSRSRAHLPKTGVSIMGLLLVAGALLTAGRLLLATRSELEKRRFG